MRCAQDRRHNLGNVREENQSAKSCERDETLRPGKGHLVGAVVGVEQSGHGLAFTGPGALDSADADALLAWLSGRGDASSAGVRTLRARGDVTIAGDRLAVAGLDATLGGLGRFWD